MKETTILSAQLQSVRLTYILFDNFSTNPVTMTKNPVTTTFYPYLKV